MMREFFLSSLLCWVLGMCVGWAEEGMAGCCELCEKGVEDEADN